MSLLFGGVCEVEVAFSFVSKDFARSARGSNEREREIEEEREQL